MYSYIINTQSTRWSTASVSKLRIIDLTDENDSKYF